MRRLAPNKFLALWLAFTSLTLSCGVNVGNPEAPDEDDDTKNKPSGEETLDLIEWHFEEALTAVYNSILAFNAGALSKVVFGTTKKIDTEVASKTLPTLLAQQRLKPESHF